MKTFLAEDNLCAQNLLRLVSHGNAVIAEILRLKDHIPPVYTLAVKELQLKYHEIVFEFNYFKISDNQEKKISTNVKLQDLDDDLKEKYLDLINRFYLLFDNIYQYIVDLNSFIEQLNEDAFIQQNIETVMRDVEGKQLLCESLYLYGAMLLLCDLYISGPVRERLLVAFYRYSTNQSQSNIDNVCKLLRDTGFDQQNCKRPNDYPVEYFSRIFINLDFVNKIIGKLRSEDIYNQLAVYTSPELQPAALATQASMLVVCLFFNPQYLLSDTSKMREIVDKFFPNNWIIPIYMGVTINLCEYWDNFKAAKLAINNSCNIKMIKELFLKRGKLVSTLKDKIQHLLKEGILTDEFVLDNVNKIVNIVMNSNYILRSLLLHTSNVIFFDNGKKSKQLKDAVLKESNFDSLQVLELLISTAELELKVREILNRLLENRQDSWNTNRTLCLDAINSLSQLFQGTNTYLKIPENDQLKLWFTNIAKQITSLDGPISSKSVKKVTQILQALEEVEEFHDIKKTSTILQLLTESKVMLKNALRTASLKEESLVTLETVADFSYAWCIIDSYTVHMQNSIKDNPGVTSRLRALFLKLASAMEIPLLRINQAQSDDLVSVSQYYSSELIEYIQKVLQIIPEMVFNIVEKIIDLQTWTIKEIPTRLEKDKLIEFSQLEPRMEVARLTHLASTFTQGILDMRHTLVGVIRVDPAELLEDGLLKELNTHITKKFNQFLDPPTRKPMSPSINNLLPGLEKLSESMDGYKRSLEYIQDYINIHGLRIWQQQLSAIIHESVAKEISLRKGVIFYSPSVSFMGSLARQIVQLIDARNCAYINICLAWFDVKTQKEIINNKTFSKLNEAIGIAGLQGLDTLYAFMIKNQLQNMQIVLKTCYERCKVTDISDVKEVEQVIIKGQKSFLQMTDILLLIGTLQILRKHIAYQINTSCKFDSAHLESSLRTMNEAILLELKSSDYQISSKKSASKLLQQLDDYLVKCGIYEPFEKIYVPHSQELSNVNLPSILAVLLISQVTRLQISCTTCDLLTKKNGENIDGYPFFVGIYTIIRQTPIENNNIFMDLLCTYLKSIMPLKLKPGDLSNESSVILRVLQIFSENFHYPFNKLEDNLPLAILTMPNNNLI